MEKPVRNPINKHAGLCVYVRVCVCVCVCIINYKTSFVVSKQIFLATVGNTTSSYRIGYLTSVVLDSRD